MELSAIDFFTYVNDNIIWGLPLIALMLVVGMMLTFRLKGIQFTHLGESLKFMIKNDEKSGKGEISSFGALCISMAATLGTGKIIGVATAIGIGGPGALFWMIFAAIFGMATKYAEGYLAIRFRKIEPDGTVIGGPFTYIEEGMGRKFKWLAICFAIFGALAGVMGIGTMTQMNSITESVVSVFDPELENSISVLGNNVSIYAIICGAIITVLAGFIVIGGVQRVSTVSTYVVPFMAIAYFLVCILVVIMNISAVPEALLTIIKSAFNFKSAAGGFAGMGIVIAMKEGFSKGVFSNEAGLGSAPIALASSKSNDAVRQGLVCMASTFIDTMILCLTIGLGIVITESYTKYEDIEITINAFCLGLNINHLTSAIIVMLSITTFAFTTIIGWNIYGEKCIAYLTKNNKKAIIVYRIIYVLSVAIAPYLSLGIIWKISSIFNGLMALPNLIGILALSTLVVKETKQYFIDRKIKKQLKEQQKHEKIINS